MTKTVSEAMMSNQKVTFPTLDNQTVVVVMQGVLALMFAGVICFLYITSKAVPETLVQLELLILGFFFGGRVAQSKTNGYHIGYTEGERATGARK